MAEIQVCSTKGTTYCKIKPGNNWTVLDLKNAIAKEAHINVNRQSIRDEVKGKDISNSSTLPSCSKLYLKDLGPQISWTGVFIAEYFGPLVVYSIFAIRPQLIYGHEVSEMSTGAFLALLCWSMHYIKRLLETIFIHRFSHGTMPLSNLFKNCSYYWGFAAFVAYHVNHPKFTQPIYPQMFVGLLIFGFSELGNLSIHILLRNLRPAGTTTRKIPVPDGNPLTRLFNLVSCPNYTYEYTAWLGFSIMTSCIPSFLFAFAGMFQMTIWALGKHRNYKKEFPNYPKQRKAIIPFIL
ncbi:PREDICTED: probable very-long-chain enoyl-CoA reductase art-1 [Nicrophorus vespilloides]|uniref:Probable very-long-chain enoyl-CoA reductase art-1 n=1 Tax=Nicrophorus vespilloides TaxID=110193 RepID=A0ABM1N7F8_NICVS|nr:PREDICTED: probable very-long-chain enoyl-CoA reductase art-1 [Nicrophorus vespilloides]